MRASVSPFSIARATRVIGRGAAVFGIHSTNQARVVIFGGGIPISLNGVVIGAVGTSGGSVEQDILVARAAMAKFDIIL